MLASWKESYDKPRQHIKKQRHHFADKGPCSQGYGFSCSNVQMWELDRKKGWALRNWCFQIVVLENTLESPLVSGSSNLSILEEITLNIVWKDCCWSSSTLATWYEELTHWKRLLCWERLKAEGEGGGRGRDGQIASLTQWIWIWANSGR